MTENLGMLNGMQIVESPLLFDALNPHTFRNERKWAHRKMWKREERFKHIPTGRMTSTVYCTNGMLFVSPAQAKLIREGGMRSYSMGFHVADPSNKTDCIAPNPLINLKGI